MAHNVKPIEQRPACADRLDLVDDAYARPGQADELRALCASCPIARDCFTEAMTRGEPGVWGGTTPYARTHARRARLARRGAA